MDIQPNANLQDLKAQWLADPCWDIEYTEGFEEHRQELLIFRLETENYRLASQLARVREACAVLKEICL
jgi:hypothetical protein